MAFTDRFIKVPTSIYNIKDKELTGREHLETIWFKFLPFELAAYRPSYGEANPSVELTLIILKNGYEVLADIPPDEFEKIVNAHRIFNDA